MKFAEHKQSNFPEAAFLWAGKSKLFYTLPLKVSINAMYERIINKYKYPAEKTALLHSDAFSYISEENDEDDIRKLKLKYDASRRFSYPLTVCTIDQLPYCDRCYDELDSDDEIDDYSYKPDPIFYGCGNRFFGIELEVDDGGKYGENATTIKDIANYRSEHIYIKSDGSLDDGFEIVSPPMTLNYHINEMNWESVMHKARNLGYRSHKTSTCGLHIHVNRNAFGDNQSEQEEAISKILFFIEKHWSEMFQFSRRSSYNMNRWSARYGFEKTGKEILDKAKSGSNGRYVAVAEIFMLLKAFGYTFI